MKRCLKRIRKSWQYKRLLRQGKNYRGTVLKAKFIKNSLGQIRLGFSVSAKTGNSVERNRFKRRLRQFSIEQETETGFDAVIFPVLALKKISWLAIRCDMIGLTEEANRREN